MSSNPEDRANASPAGKFARGRLALFLVLVVVLSLPWWYFTRQGGHLFYINALMWTPALAAVLSLKLTGGSLAELGWRGASPKWLFLAWLLVICALALVSGATLAADFTAFPNPDFIVEQRDKLHLPSATSDALVLLWYGALAVFLGGIATGAAALGEELGWRGFLTPETHARWGFTCSSLIVGVLWGLWHFPLMLGNVPAWMLAAFMIGIVGFSFVYGWLRLVSASVWPSVIMHAFHNALFGFYSRVFVFPQPGDPREIWTGESGFILGAVAVTLAILAWFNRKRAVAVFERMPTEPGR